jgi:hypothetical protein
LPRGIFYLRGIHESKPTYSTLNHFHCHSCIDHLILCRAIGSSKSVRDRNTDPTNTFTPSPTSTPSPTPTETQTPSPTPLPTGIKIQPQSDDSSLFIDYDNQYQLILPADWVVIPLGSKDLAGILNGLSDKNPKLKDIAETFRRLDPDVIRVIAMNENSKYILNGFSTNFTLTAIDNKILSAMPLDFITGAVEESLKQQGARLLSTNNLTTNNIHGVEIGTIEFEQTSPTVTGSNVQAHAKGVIFMSNGKIITLQLATLKQFAEELLPILDKVSDSIELLQP